MDDLLKWPKENLKRMEGAGFKQRLALTMMSLAYIGLLLLGLLILAPILILVGLYQKMV